MNLFERALAASNLFCPRTTRPKPRRRPCTRSSQTHRPQPSVSSRPWPPAQRKEGFGIAHAFNSFRYRDWLIYIETDMSVPPTAKLATQFLALILLQIGKALNSQMTFYFPNMSNEESEDITDDDAAEDQALKEVWQN